MTSRRGSNELDRVETDALRVYVVVVTAVMPIQNTFRQDAAGYHGLRCYLFRESQAGAGLF